MFDCTHSVPWSIYCKHDSCWEAKGLSSRMIERQMKNKKTKWFIVAFPLDSDDFARCVTIVNANSYKPRLKEMDQYGIVWQRVVSEWDNLEMLLNLNKLELLDNKLASMNPSVGDLKVFNGICSKLVFNKNYVIGSQLVHFDLQLDQYDLSPCVVLEEFPNSMIKNYSKSGVSHGATSFKKRFSVNQTDSDLVKEILVALDNDVKLNKWKWHTTTFHFCPHLISTNELTDTSIIYFAQVFGGEVDHNVDGAYCLISVEPTHPLNPLNPLNINSDMLVKYEGYEWTISPQPI